MTVTAHLAFDLPAPAVTLTAGDDPDKGRTLTGPAMPFGIPSGPSGDGIRYVFTGPPRNLTDLVDVVDEHNDNAVCGRLARPFDVTPTGLDATARIFGTTRGTDLLIETREGVKTGFSLGAAFDHYTEDAEGVRTVTDWTALHVGVVRRPAFTQAAHLAIATARKETPMTTAPIVAPPVAPTTAPIDAPPVAPTAAPSVGVAEFPTTAELAAQVLPHVRDALAADAPAPSILAEFSSPGHAVHAMMTARQSGNVERFETIRAAFAVVNQVTGNNPGAVGLPPWARSMKANLNKRRPLIEGTGGAIPIPEAGMDSQWPYYAGNLDALIAEQVNQKDELASVRIDISKGSSNLKTAGFYSDIAYQLLMRSSPSYLTMYNLILEAAWHRYTEAKYEVALAAAGTAIVPTTAVTFAGMTGVLLRALLWEASSAVEDATGAPASIVGVSSDIWKKVGTLTDLPNGKDGVLTNAAGSADATTLTVQIGGLTVRRAPFLAAKTVLATSDPAARSSEAGPEWASQEDGTKPGRDAPPGGMYTPAEVYFPAGVVKYVMA